MSASLGTLALKLILRVRLSVTDWVMGSFDFADAILVAKAYQANDIVTSGKAGIVALGRAFLADPRWPWRVATRIGHSIVAPPQLLRSVPLIRQWAGETSGT